VRNTIFFDVHQTAKFVAVFCRAFSAGCVGILYADFPVRDLDITPSPLQSAFRDCGDFKRRLPNFD